VRLVDAVGSGQAGRMASRRSDVVRRFVPWLAVWLGVQVVLVVAGRLAARRLDRGDESSASIRRVTTMGGVQLRPVNPALSSVQLDVAMGGADLDLRRLRGGDDGPGPVVDVRARVLMGGVAVHVPPGWRVWTSFRGVGGMGVAPGIHRVSDEHEADLRLHGRVLFGGVGVQTAR
jgi:hypothetical protein